MYSKWFGVRHKNLSTFTLPFISYNCPQKSKSINEEKKKIQSVAKLEGKSFNQLFCQASNNAFSDSDFLFLASACLHSLIINYMYLSGFAAIAGLFDTSLFKQKHPQKLIPYQNGIHKKFKKDLSALKKKKKKIFF